MSLSSIFPVRLNQESGHGARITSPIRDPRSPRAPGPPFQAFIEEPKIEVLDEPCGIEERLFGCEMAQVVG